MRDRIADYYPRYLRNAIVLLCAGNALVLIICLAAYWLLFHPTLTTQTFTLIGLVVIFFMVSLCMQLLLLRKITEPVKVISFAVNHVSKQLTDLPPPDINEPRFERSGLKRLVQTIYDLALNAPEIPNALPSEANAATRNSALAASKDSDTAISRNLMDELPCGVIGMNAEQKIVFYTQNAPVGVSRADNSPLLQLQFDGNELYSWLDAAQNKKVRDQKIWTRVADRLPDEENRRIFDVIARYEKSPKSGLDTLIVTVDRTEAYRIAEEDTDFIALAAHELRAPTTVIRGYLDVLSTELGDTLPAEQRELFERISVSANRLSGYINNILNVSRYDRRHLKLHLHEERLSEVIQSLVDDLDMRARTQNRLLNYDIPTDLPTIAADRNSLSEVISNLVDNAIKYSNDGGQVIVSARVNGNFVDCTVQDFGIGMPANVTENLFSKFYRSHVSRSSVAGTGLGLYISKAIIDSHGGHMWASSTEHQGSTFGFSVPIYATVAEKLQANNNKNDDIIESSNGWIKNHAMVRK